MSRTASNTPVGPFILNNEAVYPWPVYVFVPGDKGKKVKTKFMAEFKHLTQERRIEVLEQFKENLRARTLVGDAPQDEDEVETIKNVTSFEEMLLNEALTGFKGIVQTDKSPLPYNDETKAALISNAWARDALLHSYQQSLVGRSDLGN